MRWRRPTPWLGRLALLLSGLGAAACSYVPDDEGGTVAITVSPATSSAWFQERSVAVRLSPGDYARMWEAESWGPDYAYRRRAAVFRGLSTERAFAVRLPERFIHDPVSVQAESGTEVLVDVPVLLRVDYPHRASSEESDLEKVLYLDTTKSPDRFVLSWRRDGIKRTEKSVSRDLDELVKVLATEHKVHGAHMDPADRRFDQLVIIASEGVSVASLRPLITALERVDRDVLTEARRHGGEAVSKPVFQVRVAYPEDLVLHQPDAAPSRASTYSGPEPRVSLRTPEWMDGTSQKSTLESAIPSILDCYEHSLTTQPELQKSFELTIEIDVDGRVPKVVVPREHHQDRVSYCSADAVRRLQFEGIKHGHKLTIGVVLGLAGGPP